MSAPRRPQTGVVVQRAVAARNLPAPGMVRKWVHAALEHDARVTVRFVGRLEGRALNRNYRSRDYATNVLTFVFRDVPPFEGDLALCAPVVTREAREQRKSAISHYAHLVVHGILHLQGYDHETEAEARIMEARETRILRELGYPDPYLHEKKKTRRKVRSAASPAGRAGAARRRSIAPADHGRIQQ